MNTENDMRIPYMLSSTFLHNRAPIEGKAAALFLIMTASMPGCSVALHFTDGLETLNPKP